MPSKLLDEEKRSKEAEARKAEKHAQLRADAAQVFGSEAGERIFWHILERCGVFSETFSGNARDIYQKGRRSIGIELMQLRDMANFEGIKHLELHALKKLLARKESELKRAEG